MLNTFRSDFTCIKCTPDESDPNLNVNIIHLIFLSECSNLHITFFSLVLTIWVHAVWCVIGLTSDQNSCQ